MSDPAHIQDTQFQHPTQVADPNEPLEPAADMHAPIEPVAAPAMQTPAPFEQVTEPAFQPPVEELPTDMGVMPAEVEAYTEQPADPGFEYPEEHQYQAAEPAYNAAAPEEEDMSHIRPVPRVAIQAFCETDAVANVIERASEDRRMAKAHVMVQSGGTPAAVEYYQTNTTPNLIILESLLTGMDLVDQLQSLAEVCDEGTNVMVVGHQNDVQLYRELTSRGVSEYLVAPISMGQLMEIINELFVNPEAEPLGHTLAFIGAKGGVGSSTIAHNIAFTISSSFSSDVVLADMDLAFGTANIDFDQDPAQGIAEAVFSPDRIDDTYLDRLLAKCSDHLSLLAAPSTLDREYDFEEDAFRQVLEVAQRGTPNVVLDMPHLWTGWARSVLSGADKIVITATPDLACLRNTKNFLDTLQEIRPNDDKPLLVLNQCNVPKRPEISTDDFSEALGIEPTIIIPFEPALFGQAANNGQMIAESDPKSEVAASLELLAQVATGRREIQPPKKGFTESLREVFKRKKK